jgi:uncharacterized membrane protein (DUF106 family)
VTGLSTFFFQALFSSASKTLFILLAMAKTKKQIKVHPTNKRKIKRQNEEKELQELEKKASDPVRPFRLS